MKKSLDIVICGPREMWENDNNNEMDPNDRFCKKKQVN
jgi:hypothetical protein